MSWLWLRCPRDGDGCTLHFSRSIASGHRELDRYGKVSGRLAKGMGELPVKIVSVTDCKGAKGIEIGWIGIDSV